MRTSQPKPLVLAGSAYPAKATSAIIVAEASLSSSLSGNYEFQLGEVDEHADRWMTDEASSCCLDKMEPSVGDAANRPGALFAVVDYKRTSKAQTVPVQLSGDVALLSCRSIAGLSERSLDPAYPRATILSFMQICRRMDGDDRVGQDRFRAGIKDLGNDPCGCGLENCRHTIEGTLFRLPLPASLSQEVFDPMKKFSEILAETPRRLDDNQIAAISCDDRNAVVSAGAGSGKTTVLSYRFLRLVVEGKAHVDEILTLTFTRKAAAEMHERIHRQCSRIAGS
jgi:hypothetical protein